MLLIFIFSILRSIFWWKKNQKNVTATSRLDVFIFVLFFNQVIYLACLFSFLCVKVVSKKVVGTNNLLLNQVVTFWKHLMKNESVSEKVSQMLLDLLHLSCFFFWCEVSWFEIQRVYSSYIIAVVDQQNGHSMNRSIAYKAFHLLMNLPAARLFQTEKKVYCLQLSHVQQCNIVHFNWQNELIFILGIVCSENMHA